MFKCGAASLIKPSVQVDDLPIPGGLVQTVHVLGEEDVVLTFWLPARKA